jgi:hypothetical protein
MYRRYLRILLGLCGIAAAFAFDTVVSLEPLSGDLTRLGGYSENEFGWNGVEEKFAPPLAEAGRLDGGYGVVVIGDSFSLRTTPDRQTEAGSFWTDFLANDTGLRVGVFDVAVTPMERYLASPSYRDHPPRLVILELAERTLRNHLAGPADCASARQPMPVRLDAMPDPLLPGGSRRQVMRWSIGAAADQAADYLRKNIFREFFSIDTTMAMRLPLSRSDLFTSRRPQDLLVFTEDLDKAGWSDGDWRAMRCRLSFYQREVATNGVTAFLFVLVPDKSTAYARYLPPAPWQINAAEHLADLAGLDMPRLDVALRSAIAGGVRDVYLPDDSHWSATGSRIAAETVLQYLRPGTPPNPPATGAGGPTASR